MLQMKDLVYFMVIMLVFIVGYGIAIQKIMYPDTPLTLNIVDFLIRRAFFQINGEFQLDEATNCK